MLRRTWDNNRADGPSFGTRAISWATCRATTHGPLIVVDLTKLPAVRADCFQRAVELPVRRLPRQADAPRVENRPLQRMPATFR
jgi:hypothetical protein